MPAFLPLAAYSAAMEIAKPRRGCPGCLEECALDQLSILDEQPTSTETTADGVFTKTFVLTVKGSMVPQHAHRTAHLTAIVKGGIRVWVNGKLDRDYFAPEGVVIPAGDLHHFQTLEADTTLMCIHDVSHGSIVMVAENSIPGIG